MPCIFDACMVWQALHASHTKLDSAHQVAGVLQSLQHEQLLQALRLPVGQADILGLMNFCHNLHTFQHTKAMVFGCVTMAQLVQTGQHSGTALPVCTASSTTLVHTAVMFAAVRNSRTSVAVRDYKGTASASSSSSSSS